MDFAVSILLMMWTISVRGMEIANIGSVKKMGKPRMIGYQKRYIPNAKRKSKKKGKVK